MARCRSGWSGTLAPLVASLAACATQPMTGRDVVGADDGVGLDSVGTDARPPDATPRDGDASTDATPRDSETGTDAARDAGPVVLVARNPVLTGDAPDPQVVRTRTADGQLIYYLYATGGLAGDFPVYESRDLVRWVRRPEGLLRRPATPGNSVEIHGRHYCHLWAPSVVEVRAGVWQLSFTAVRYATARAPCPGYAEDGGVYLASSTSPTGPFAIDATPWEPLPAGGHITMCPASTRDAIPRSVDVATGDCLGSFCHHVVRLDSDVYRDPLTNRWWMSYAWYTNTPPLVPWEQANYGQHVGVVELDAADPWAVRCTASVAQVHIGNAHDGASLTRLAAYCPRCGELLSMTSGRGGVPFRRDGYTFGVNEGPSLFRRGALVYAFMSGSVWDSPNYHVFWAAAATVEQLSWDNPARLVGRYLVPGGGMSFGHGSIVVGPDDRSLFYLFHRLRANDCAARGDCARDVWIAPLEFEDRGDGRGDVWVRPVFPAESGDVRVPRAP